MKEGYLVKFFTQQNREYNGASIAGWLVDEAKKIGIRGATLFSGKEGFGHDGRYHGDTIFGFEDPPVQVDMALTFEEYDKLMLCIKESGLRIFFTKSKIEFGYTSES